jgi:DNA-binding LytR/AlgR family response regulator
MVDYLIISNSVELVRVLAERIIYISSDGNYSTMVLNNEEKHVFSFNLSAFQTLIETQLKSEAQQFIRIGKSLIINRNYIYHIHPAKQLLLLSDKFSHKCFEVPASKEALKLLKATVESSIKK